MKNLMLVFSLLTVCPAFAQSKGIVILDCNINAWPYQQFRVVQTREGGMALDQLTTEGRWISSALSHLEWERRTFNLERDTHGNQIEVTQTDKGWYYHSPGAAGYADCD